MHGGGRENMEERGIVGEGRIERGKREGGRDGGGIDTRGQ